MSIDQLRAEFESDIPPPAGIKFDGDHYGVTNSLVASFRNATEWNAMWRGYKRRAEHESLLAVAVGYMGASGGCSVADVSGRIAKAFVECSETQPGAAQPFIKVKI